MAAVNLPRKNSRALLLGLFAACLSSLERLAQAMFDTLCTLSLQSDLFAQSLHPSSPLLAVGLSSGHVQAYKLPPPPGVPDSATSIASYASEPRSETSDGLSEVQTTWRTRRHKGSCRALGFSWDGHEVVSSGTDGLVKGALSEDGRVLWKVAVPFDG